VLLVPSFIVVCSGCPLLFFNVFPFIFHCIFPSFSGTPCFVVIVVVRVFFCPAVIVVFCIVTMGVCLFTVIVLVIFASLVVIVMLYFPAFSSVIGVIVIPLVIWCVVVLFCIVIFAVPLFILLLY